jgi:hypothetical protein
LDIENSTIARSYDSLLSAEARGSTAEGFTVNTAAIPPCAFFGHRRNSGRREFDVKAVIAY